MTVQRDVSPLPVGIYWIDVKETQVPAFNMWLRLSAGVGVISTVEDRPEPFFGSRSIFSKSVTWFLFEVTSPTHLPAHFGFPNIAEQGRDTTLDDVIQEPPPEPGLLAELPTVGDIKIGLSVGAVALGLALLAALLYKGRS